MKYNSLKKELIFFIVFIFIGTSFSNICSSYDNKSYITLYNQKEEGKSITGPLPSNDIGEEVDSMKIREPTIISGVPSYLWHNGCGPTAAGMVIGFWDINGYEDLVEGNASFQTEEVNNMISSQGNYNDYCLPLDYHPGPILPDKSEPPIGDEHDNNCLADFMKTSQSYYNNYYGWSWYRDVNISLFNYIRWVYPDSNIIVNNLYWGDFSWNIYCNEINAGRPLVFLVDTNGDGRTDHFITAIGYDENHNYACFNTWDNDVHWYEFAKISNGQEWGIYGATLCSFTNNPPKTPIIDGPIRGKAGIEHCWNFNSTDPNGNPIRYLIDWGDGTYNETECYPSGKYVVVCHTYNKGTYVIKARAQECSEDSLYSDFGEFQFSASKYKKSLRLHDLNNNKIIQFLFRFLEIFKK
jgi:hypothetical protein